GDGAADAQDAASDEEDPWGPNADLPDEDEDAAPSDDDEAAAALGDWNVDDDEDTGRDQVPAPSKHVPARPARSAARPATDASEGLAARLQKQPLVLGGIGVGILLLLLVVVWAVWPTSEPDRNATRAIEPPPGVITSPVVSEEPGMEAAENAAGAEAAALVPDEAPAEPEPPETGPATGATPGETLLAAGNAPETSPEGAPDAPVEPPPASSLMEDALPAGQVSIQLKVPDRVKVVSSGPVLDTSRPLSVATGPMELKLYCPVRERPFSHWLRIQDPPGRVQTFDVKCVNQPLL